MSWSLSTWTKLNQGGAADPPSLPGPRLPFWKRYPGITIERRVMEKWKPHPTRANIFINQDTGLLYRKTEAGSFRRIPQKMTEHQEVECFRRNSGIVRMTSRSRGRVAPQSEQHPPEDHT